MHSSNHVYHAGKKAQIVHMKSEAGLDLHLPGPEAVCMAIADRPHGLLRS